jgi:bifunctional non-homologous end joining protein LigD
VETASIFSESNRKARDFVVCNNLSTLLWLGQIAAVDLNPWNSHVVANQDPSSSKEALEATELNHPDFLVFDLDPHFGGKATRWERTAWERLVEVAVSLKETLNQLGLKLYPKSSGKSGLHLYLPIEPEYTYDQVRAAARTFGEQTERKLGKKVTLEWNVKKRPDGVFIDVNQNVRGKTMAAAYSPRAAIGAGVSMPLRWEELDAVDPTSFTVMTAARRLSKVGDLWSETISVKQKLL